MVAQVDALLDHTQTAYIFYSFTVGILSENKNYMALVV